MNPSPVTDDFYSQLPAITQFGLVADEASLHAVPSDWVVVVTDVVNSTQAIDRGEYKEVNTAGALSLVALVNAGLNGKVATVFGGDGILLLAPPSSRALLLDLFAGLRRFVAESFDLDLRVGLVPVARLYDQGLTLRLGKFAASKRSTQAIFSGTGLEVAERLIKQEGSSYLIPEDHVSAVEPDFSGYSCPFREVGSDDERVLALIVKATGTPPHYETLIEELLGLLGPESEFHPVTWSNLNVRTTAGELRNWAVVASGQTRGVRYQVTNFVLRARMAVSRLLTAMIREVGRRELPLLTDHKKFDGSLKMVIKLPLQTRDRLVAWLESQESEGALVFGLHESSATLITCVFQGSNDENEIHLIDGSEGGYTLAAKQLKQKLARV